MNGDIDILIVAETKLDKSFPTAQFQMDNYNKPLRKDISSRSGGLLLYTKKGIAAKPLKIESADDDLQIIAITLHLKTSNGF